MPSLHSRLFLPALLLAVQLMPKAAGLSCRNLPGDPNFPSPAVWDTFNASIGGRLVAVVPSAKFCHKLPAGQCGEDMWESTVFRAGVPGAMDNVSILCLKINWVTPDHHPHRPTGSRSVTREIYCSRQLSCVLIIVLYRIICRTHRHCAFKIVRRVARATFLFLASTLRKPLTSKSATILYYCIIFNTDTPLYLAWREIRIGTQSPRSCEGVLVMTSSARSTAKGSLLLWTHHLQNITFTESFVVGGKNLGSAMTVGTGVPANTLYEATKQVGKFLRGA